MDACAPEFVPKCSGSEIPPQLTQSLIERAHGVLRWHYTSSAPEAIGLRADASYTLFPIPITEQALFESDQGDELIPKIIVKLPPPPHTTSRRSPTLKFPRHLDILRWLGVTEPIADVQTVHPESIEAQSKPIFDINHLGETKPIANVRFAEQLQKIRKTVNPKSVEAQSESVFGIDHVPLESPKVRLSTLAFRSRPLSQRIAPRLSNRARTHIHSLSFSLRSNRFAGIKACGTGKMYALSFPKLCDHLQNKRAMDTNCESRRNPFRSIMKPCKCKVLIAESGLSMSSEADVDVLDTAGIPHELEVRNQIPPSFGPKDLHSWPLHSVTHYQQFRSFTIAIHDAICLNVCPEGAFMQFLELADPYHPREVNSFLVTAIRDYPYSLTLASELSQQASETYQFFSMIDKLYNTDLTLHYVRERTRYVAINLWPDYLWLIGRLLNCSMSLAGKSTTPEVKMLDDVEQRFFEWMSEMRRFNVTGNPEPCRRLCRALYRYWEEYVLRDRASDFVLDLLVRNLIEKEDFWRLAREYCANLRTDKGGFLSNLSQQHSQEPNGTHSISGTPLPDDEEQARSDISAAIDKFVLELGRRPQALEVVQRLIVGGRKPFKDS